MTAWNHPQLDRRTAIQAGAVGLLGLGINHLSALRQTAEGSAAKSPRARSVIYIFLSGGLAQHESFDPKPDAPDGIRGEFKPIATRTAGVHICEHLPLLAARSDRWALVRSLTHPYNEHSEGHLAMLTGRTPKPRGFDLNKPKSTDWPSIAAIAGDRFASVNNLPPAVVLPERLIHFSGRVIPGQFAGEMGARRDPWFVQAVPYNPKTYGAYGEYEFHHERGRVSTPGIVFQSPNLSLPHGLVQRRLDDRLTVLDELDRQRGYLDRAGDVAQFDRYRQSAVSLLVEPCVRAAFDVQAADPKLQERYGRNSFGWSLLMARQLVEAGVALVQVNLGNNETWDTHQSAFPCLKNFLLPPMDRAVSALLDDLSGRGLLDSTLVVMAGEFGRTPRIFSLGKGKLPGRDHWGAVQSVFFAGGGVRGGTVIGSSDKSGGYPAGEPQQPENMAATIYQALGIPAAATWKDDLDRPHPIYHGEPIRGLMG